jgi:hypothetical protein
MRAEALRVAFNEVIDWQGIGYYSLPKSKREQVLKDLEVLKVGAAEGATQTMSKVPDWNRDGMNGLALARDVLKGAYANVREKYAVRCLKQLDQAE